MMAPATQALDGLLDLLGGKVLRRSENQFDRDSGGGSSYSERSKAIFLYADGSFRYEERTFAHLSAAGMSIPSERRHAGEGTWSVEIVTGRPALVLRQDGRVAAWWHTRDGGVGVQYLDGEPWTRYRIR
jgi:hypothetical protein